jgi:hypothetical protein
MLDPFRNLPLPIFALVVLILLPLIAMVGLISLLDRDCD